MLDPLMKPQYGTHMHIDVHYTHLRLVASCSKTQRIVSGFAAQNCWTDARMQDWDFKVATTQNDFFYFHSYYMMTFSPPQSELVH
jgi:hypothetical protein